MKDDEPHDVRQFRVGDGRCLRRTAGDGGALQVTMEDDGGRHNVVHPGPGPGRTDRPVENTG